MVEIKDCSLTTEFEEGGVDYLLTGQGSQRVTATATVGVGALAGANATIEMVIGAAERFQQDTFLTAPESRATITADVSEPGTNGVPSAPANVPVTINVLNVDDPDSVTCGTLRVREASQVLFDPDRAGIDGCARLDTSIIAPGETVQATIEAFNRNPIPAIVEVEATANGRTIERDNFAVGAETDRDVVTLDLDTSSLAAGDYRSEVNETDVRSG